MPAAPRPRLKVAAALLRGNGDLHIVGIDRVVTFQDPDGAVHRLLELADGSRSTSELYSALAPEYPQLEHRDIVDAVSQLEATGLFEDCTPRRRILGGRDRAPLALHR